MVRGNGNLFWIRLRCCCCCCRGSSTAERFLIFFFLLPLRWMIVLFSLECCLVGDWCVRRGFGWNVYVVGEKDFVFFMRENLLHDDSQSAVCVCGV